MISAIDSLLFAKQYLGNGLPRSGLARAWKRFRRIRREHGLEVGEFFEFRLWRPELSCSQFLAFIGWKKHITTLVALNPPPYRCLTENKLVFYEICRATGLPTPEVYAVIDPALGRGGTVPVLHSLSELPGLLTDRGVARFVLKPANGTRGQTILILDYDSERGFATAAGEPISERTLQESLRYEFRGRRDGSFLVQERILPNEFTLNINNHCPMSYRITTILDSNGDVYCLPHTLAKLALPNMTNDNIATGGIALIADEFGVCLGAYESGSYANLLDRHPSLDFKFGGWCLPCFDEAHELAMRAAREFGWSRCVGWDIAVGRDGLTVYEGNNPFSKDIQLISDKGLWQGVFKTEAEKAISDPIGPPPWW